jgi:hypothetical protein
MQDDQSLESHVQAVNEWLKANIRVYPEPAHITLRQIQFNPKTLSGSALLVLGNEVTGESLSLRMSETGWLTFSVPLFHSPLGAPASYAAIELTTNTQSAVTAAVRSLLPRLMPLGINPKTKEWITTSTPLQARISDASELMGALERIGHPDFECRHLVATAIPQF